MDFDYYKQHKQEILSALVNEALSLPAGTETSLACLLFKVYSVQSEDMLCFDLWNDFVREAKNHNLTLKST